VFGQETGTIICRRTLLNMMEREAKWRMWWAYFHDIGELGFILVCESSQFNQVKSLEALGEG